MGEHAGEDRKAWGRGTTVSVFRLPSADRPMARAIGIGELATRLEVGRPIQLRLDSGSGGRVLAGTMVVEIESIAPDVVRIATHNHRYELRQVTASVTGRAAPDLATARDASPHPGPGMERTQVVAVDDWPEAAPGRFEAGARVRLAKEDGNGTSDGSPAILLVDLVPGECASFSVDGRVVATSAVRQVVALDARRVRLVTGNSTYRLELASDGDDEESHV